MKIVSVFTFCLFLQSCQSKDPALIIQESYVSNSLAKGETFMEAYLKLRFPLQDTLLRRLAFPFTVTHKLNNEDWKTDNFHTLQDFEKFPLFQKTINAIKDNMPYDDSYRRIFADLTQHGQQLKIIQKEKEKGFRFICKNGRWYLAEYTESLVEF